MKKYLIILLLALITLMLVVMPVAMAEVVDAMPAQTSKTVDLTPLLQAAISVVAAILMYMVAPWIKANASKAQYSYLLLIVKTLVFAAGKLYETGKITDKLMYVQERLRKRGFALDIDAIEAMVKELDLQEESLRIHESNPPNTQDDQE